MFSILGTDAKISVEKDENLIETTCKNTPHYQLCINTLRADKGSSGADVAGLGLIMVEAVKAKSKEALSAIKKLQKSQPKLATPLQQCRDMYKAVVSGDVPEAEQSIRGNPKFAENGMADAAVEADDCEAAFQGVAKSPLTAVNTAARELAEVARDLTWGVSFCPKSSIFPISMDVGDGGALEDRVSDLWWCVLVLGCGCCSRVVFVGVG
ncbi:hypothetical protein DH2020_020115 [Rehmannia glutinosa]|uniref:Pectinesterase inhibitor domain-containing protein n=1 Tax=Rehmannia glutinosa TaxID=99300 RepID=A0ABR0WHB8_REHGL